ncbi:DUF2953 domain-containing protein [Marinisporobacter balticus]|nr:DUF2953 domain-containing protein [Marinisporobacter balticus]
MLIIVFSILFFVPITISIKILKDGTNDKVILKIKTLFGLFNYKIEIPFVDLDMKKNGIPFLKLNTEVKKNEDELIEENKTMVTFEEIKKIVKKAKYFLKYYTSPIKYVLEKMKISDFLWTTEFGIENAAVTGLLSGILWAAKSQLITIMRNNITCSKVTLKVIPKFNKESFKTTIHCIINTKIGYIIIATIKFGYTFIRKRW